MKFIKCMTVFICMLLVTLSGSFLWAADSKIETESYDSLPNPHITQSGGSYLSGDGKTLYTFVFAGLSAADYRSVCQDFVFIKEKGIKNWAILLNSGGGDAFAGLSLADTITAANNRGIETTVYASGIIASAAVPILAAGKHRVATSGTLFMVHQVSLQKYLTEENASDIATQSEMLNMLTDKYLKFLTDNTTVAKEEWQMMLKKTSWFDTNKAKEIGLVHTIE